MSPLAYTPAVARVRGLVTVEIRSVVRTLTEQLHADGLAPEKVRVAVKALVREMVAPSISTYVDSQGREYSAQGHLQIVRDVRHRPGELALPGEVCGDVSMHEAAQRQGGRGGHDDVDPKDGR